MYYSTEEQKGNEMWGAILKFIIFLAIFSFATFVLPSLLLNFINLIGQYVIGGF